MNKEELAKIREDLIEISKLTDTQLNAFLTMHNFMNSENVSINNDDVMDTEGKGMEENNEKKVIELLKQIGVPFHIKGYNYLRDAILMMLDNPSEYVNRITKALYPEIAKKYSTTTSRVERAIRHAIDVAWTRGDCDLHNKIFGYTISKTNCRPTNSEAIAALPEYIKMYM